MLRSTLESAIQTEFSPRARDVYHFVKFQAEAGAPSASIVASKDRQMRCSATWCASCTVAVSDSARAPAGYTAVPGVPVHGRVFPAPVR
jgi:hypothetical protein